LPLATEMDRIVATPARAGAQARAAGSVASFEPAEARLTWTAEAQALLAERVTEQPILLQISAAKRLRDGAEAEARRAGVDAVSRACVEQAHRLLTEGALA
jgi:3,8-divinyl chlorophyllide a/chlorophyllide a reductase subunit Z